MRIAQAGFKTGNGAETAADLLVRVGPTMRVDLGRRRNAPLNQKPNLDAKGVLALVDTGAGGNCIDDDLARELGLPMTGEGSISGVGGLHDAVLYTARLYCPVFDRTLFETFAGVKLAAGQQDHRVILGRTFLRPYRVSYNGLTGQVEIIED